MDGAPVATERRSWLVRAAGRVAAFVVTAVFGFGLLTALALVGLGALLFLALDHATLGIGLTVGGLAIGLICAVAQGTPG
jgi:prepilin signal peptidase PulO-like enzyme (type II secretory pathway)